jgi:3-deoxy-7-phosphoheptulonate synthase
MEVCGVTEKSQGVSEVDFFTSHEGLVMEYESAVTQLVTENNKHYNLGAHFLWIGNRTRDV